MIAVWVLLAAVALVSFYFLFQVVRKLSRTMGALVKGIEELGEVAVELQRLKGETQNTTQNEAQGEVKEQNGSVDDASRQ